jgi:hypothetical protein
VTGAFLFVGKDGIDYPGSMENAIDFKKPIEVLETLTQTSDPAGYLLHHKMVEGRYEIKWKGEIFLVGPDNIVMRRKEDYLPLGGEFRVRNCL